MSTMTDGVSPPSKLWAVPTKEWVIPAKPKPGRKPKKDLNAPIDEEKEGEPGARRNNNRAAQRAFRERKQSQFAELQARVRAYEQGQTERGVELQNLARGYKEENERLRAENAALQQKIAQLEGEKLVAVAALYQPRKRAATVDDTVPVQSSKRARTVAESLPPPSSILNPYTSPPSPPSSIESYPSPTFEASPVYRTVPPETSLFPNYPNRTNNLARTYVADDTDSPFEKFDCGFCDDITPCVCREILQQHVADRIGRPDQPTIKIDHVEAPGIASYSTSQTKPSILDHLPAYQPAVPLRRKAPNKQTTGGNSIFPILQSPPLPPTCSGDPRNCRVCASDDFGQAFCDAVNDSMAASEGADAMDTSSTESSVKIEPETQAMVPRDAAWKQLKSHPNAEFSDLRLLADVCTGRGVVVSPVTPERVTLPTVASSRPSRLQALPRDILNTRDGTVARRHQGVGIRAFRAEAVQAALHLLDAKKGMLSS